MAEDSTPNIVLVAASDLTFRRVVTVTIRGRAQAFGDSRGTGSSIAIDRQSTHPALAEGHDQSAIETD